MRHRHELSDAQWRRIEPLLPGKAGDPGRTAGDNRLFVNAAVYVLKTGIPWADLPERFGKPNTVWKHYDRWCAAGVWERVGRALGEHDEVQLDSTSVKAHPTASTGRRVRDEKTRRRRATMPWPITWRTDHEVARGGERSRSAAASDPYARPTWRRAAGRSVARWTAYEARAGRHGVRQRCDPHIDSPDESPGVHQTQSDPQAEQTLRSPALQTS